MGSNPSLIPVYLVKSTVKWYFLVLKSLNEITDKPYWRIVSSRRNREPDQRGLPEAD